ncbi:MAG: glycosyltransferase, partial [Methanobrevibacter sp.]|nr:glycosyltransferase [Candidatus Methanovirga basalitermitum]
MNVLRVELGNQNLLKYLFNSRIKLHFKIPDSDIYHGLGVPFTHTFHKDKTVVTVHDILELDFSSLSPFLKNERQRVIEKLNRFDNKRATLKCRHIITSSNETKDKLNSLYGVDLDRISVVRFGFIDENLFSKNKETETYNIGT